MKNKHTLTLALISMGLCLTACQPLADFAEQKPTNKSAEPVSTPTPTAPFKKVTQEERDRAERNELERKKCKEAFEFLHLCT